MSAPRADPRVDLHRPCGEGSNYHHPDGQALRTTGVFGERCGRVRDANRGPGVLARRAARVDAPAGASCVNATATRWSSRGAGRSTTSVIPSCTCSVRRHGERRRSSARRRLGSNAATRWPSNSKLGGLAGLARSTPTPSAERRRGRDAVGGDESAMGTATARHRPTRSPIDRHRRRPLGPHFDDADDLDGLLSARSPLLSRAFRGTDRPD